jgi:hypothetical protein
MKTFLVFSKNGEISEHATDCKKFNETVLLGYKHFKRYENYIVLYNRSDTDTKNITVLQFTPEKFESDIALIKVDDQDNIINNDYIKKIVKIKTEPNDLYYSSDEDYEIEDVNPY